MHKWTSAIDGMEEVFLSGWSEDLAGVTGPQIANGLKSLPDDWPPSADEFRALCLGKIDDWEHSGPAYKILDKSRLLGSDQNKELGQSAVSKMKDLLKGDE